MRLSESGVDFIESNLGAILETLVPGGLTFDIPRIDTTQSIPVVGDVEIHVCEDENCTARIEIQNVEITPTAPNRLHLTLQVILDSRDGAGARRALPIRLRGGCTFLGCAINTTCQADIDTRRGDREFVAFAADIDFVTETEAARAGYTRIDISNAALVEGQDIEDPDIEFGDCSGISGAIINAVSGLLTGTLIDQLQGQISGLLNSAIGDQLCTQRGEFGCPTNTCADGAEPTSICRFEPRATCSSSDSRCVPMLLGTDGQGDLGAAFLGGFSPGTHAPGRFLLASGGDGEAVNAGMSLFMYGGFTSTDRTFTMAPGHNPCVPLLPPPELPEIPRVMSFRGNTIPGTSTATHLGIGIAEDYLDHAGYGMFDSGMLCIGAGTRLSQQLESGLISALIRSLGALAFPESNAPLTIAIRPQQPPDFAIGTDSGTPLLTITLPQAQMDFYVWSTERYVRFMTYQTDLVIAIDLVVEGGQIVPMIRSVTPTNSSVSNSELLTDPPEAIAMALESIITAFAGMFTDSIGPIDLPSVMGFDIMVPEGGIRGVADSGHNFLGIFANLALATAPLTRPVETALDVSDLALDPESMTLDHWGQGRGNTAWLYFDAGGVDGVDYEFSYRIDGGIWSAWTRDRRVQIDDSVLLLQAHHEIEARARVVGEPASMDRTPARADLLIDILAPEVALEPTGHGFHLRARDVVSGDQLQYRFRVGDGEWTEWSSIADLELGIGELTGDVIGEARDEAGNVGSASEPLIRGIPNPNGGGGCGCTIPGDDAPEGSGLGLSAIVAALAFVLSRGFRRRRPARKEARRSAGRFLGLFLSALTVAALTVGCDCGGGNTGAPCDDACSPAAPPGLTMGSMCCESTDMCVSYDVDGLCDPGFTCPVANVTLDAACEISCSMCMRKPALRPGLLATDLDLSVTESGSIFVSGYSAGVPTSTRYGDLVVGRVMGSGEPDWDIADGAPTMPITNDPDGWRDGVAAPGDDVGRWTSMVATDSVIYVAHYDQTHGALRITIGMPDRWSSHTIDDVGDAGRYASLVLTASGAPAIAYLRVEAPADASGQPHSSVRVAIASSAMPADETDWTITEVAGAAVPCRAEHCSDGQVCLETGACVTPSTDCTDTCADDTACSMGSCVTTIPEGYIEDIPPVFGAYAQLRIAGTGLALIWYDRSQGNLWGSAYDGTAWSAPLLIDGYARMAADAGDSGIGASLFVDTAGTWHVTYVDGAEEALRYAQVSAGAVTLRETVDDGSLNPADGMRFTDGRHIVGDDSSVVVTDSGEVRVAYQDATAHRAYLARRASGGTWTREVVDEMNHTGFWVEQVLVGASTSYVVTWWREATAMGTQNGVRVMMVE